MTQTSRLPLDDLVERGHGPVRGIIHVGAHEGQEIHPYLQRRWSPVVAFEPLPQFAARADEVFKRELARGALGWAPLALGDREGRLTLKIPRHLHDPGEADTMCATALDPIPNPAHPWSQRDIGWAVEVPVLRFDQWAKGRNLWAFSTVVVDVQGMELQVLQGFGERLADFEHLCVECAHEPIYEGQAPAADVVAFLFERGFLAITDPAEREDVLFVRTR